MTVSRPDLPFAERLELARSMVRRGPPADLPGHLADQFEAANREVNAIVSSDGAVHRALQPDKHWRGGQGYLINDEQHAYLVACVLGLHACLHVAATPQPAVSLLRSRRLLCRDCLQRMPLWLLPTIDDDCCDVCGRHGVRRFTPFEVAFGSVVLGGDACTDCATAIIGHKPRRAK